MTRIIAVRGDCGVCYPVDEAARIAVGVSREGWDLDEIRFVLFSLAVTESWQEAHQ
jgi:hypothetical protein